VGTPAGVTIDRMVFWLASRVCFANGCIAQLWHSNIRNRICKIASGMISRITYPAYHAACDLAYPVPVLLKKPEVMRHTLRVCEPIRIKFFVDFADYFGRFLIIFWWVIYLVDITHQKIIKNRLKRTAKSTETFYPDRFVCGFSFCRFPGSFEPIFDSFLGGNINCVYNPPKKESKSGQNNPGNRRNLNSQTDS